MDTVGSVDVACVYRYWPDDCRAVCTCGWIGSPHIFKFLGVWDLKRHCRDTGHLIDYPMVRWARNGY